LPCSDETVPVNSPSTVCAFADAMQHAAADDAKRIFKALCTFMVAPCSLKSKLTQEYTVPFSRELVAQLSRNKALRHR